MTKAQRKKFIKDTFSATQVGVLLEDMQDGIKVIGEQHGEIIKKIESLDEKVESLDKKVESLDERVESLDERVGLIDKKLDNFINETNANFKAVFNYLSRIEDDFIVLKEKVNKLENEKTNSKDFDWLKNKVLELEKRLDEYKKQQSALAAKL